jgi:hypothetical protein
VSDNSNPGATVDAHDLQRGGYAETADKGTPSSGSSGDAVGSGGWEAYSPDTLAALFDFDGWSHVDP